MARGTEETPQVDRSNDSSSATTFTSNTSTSHNETKKNNTSGHRNATNTFSNSLPPSSTTSFDNDNSNDSSSNEYLSPWLIHINVTDLFQTYQQQISQVFGLAILHSQCDHVLSDLMETTDSTEDNQPTDDEFMIIRTIHGINTKLDLLSLSARMTGNKGGVWKESLTCYSFTTTKPTAELGQNRCS